MRPPLPLTDFAQIKILADAQRLALLRRLMAAPASLTALSRRCGETPAHLRHHLKALEEARLVELDSTRPARGFTEKIYRATASAYLIQLAILPEAPAKQKTIVLGSNDRAVEGLADYLEQKHAKVKIQLLALDSLHGLIALRQGLCQIAGCHLLDAQSGDYNAAYVSRLFPGQAMAAIRLAQRAVGLLVSAGNPRRIRALADLARPAVRFVNRERGSGTRLWLDQALQQAGIPPEAIGGYAKELGTHAAVAQAISAGQADAGLGLAAVAREFQLDFIPLFEEPYDLVLPTELLTQASYQSFFDLLCSGDFRQFVAGLNGYNANASGARRELGA